VVSRYGWSIFPFVDEGNLNPWSLVRMPRLQTVIYNFAWIFLRIKYGFYPKNFHSEFLINYNNNRLRLDYHLKNFQTYIFKIYFLNYLNIYYLI
jgi:hypothetical protein